MPSVVVMSDARIALVTGASQGLGFALAAGLAARMDPDDLVLLTGRHARRVADAAATVTTRAGTRSRVTGRVLDVAGTGAVAGLAAELADRHGGADILISNAIAALTPDRPQSEQADEFIDVANGGTHAVLRSFGPVLRPGGRLIVVASSLGTLGHLDPRLQPLFDRATLEEVEAAVESWRTAIHDGTAEEQGWPRWINVPSKVAQVEGTLLAAVCPGLVDTRASRPWFDDYSRAQTPEQAARAVLDLILAGRPDPATYGELIQFGQVLPWHSGTPFPSQDQMLSR
jgi:carbonyl reductase 1